MTNKDRPNEEIKAKRLRPLKGRDGAMYMHVEILVRRSKFDIILSQSSPIKEARAVYLQLTKSIRR